MNWRAIVYYGTATGLIDVEHYFEKLHDLHDLVEQGPTRNTLDRIEAFIAHRCAMERTADEHAG
jgi:hypothetical protein